MVGQRDFQQFVGMCFNRTFFVEVRKCSNLTWDQAQNRATDLDKHALCGRLRHICSRWGPEMWILRYNDSDKAVLKLENSYHDLRNLGENHPLKTLFHLLNPDAICHVVTYKLDFLYNCSSWVGYLQLSAIVRSTNSLLRSKFTAVR